MVSGYTEQLKVLFRACSCMRIVETYLSSLTGPLVLVVVVMLEVRLSSSLNEMVSGYTEQFKVLFRACSCMRELLKLTYQDGYTLRI